MRYNEKRRIKYFFFKSRSDLTDMQKMIIKKLQSIPDLQCIFIYTGFLLSLLLPKTVLAERPGPAPAAYTTTQEEYSYPDTDIRDPWQKFNRKVFRINTALDKALILPLAKLYRAVTFRHLRLSVRNIINNTQAPVIFANDILQGEFRRAGITVSRFAINSTIGIAGIADPATRMDLPRHSEDFGQTLAVWHIPSGPYIVLPLMGPATLRDTAGKFVDRMFSPLFWIDTNASDAARASLTAAGILSLREELIEPVEQIEKNSLDYYTSVYSLYVQSRQKEIMNGQESFGNLPDIAGFEDY